MNDMCDLIVSTFTVKEQEGTIVPSVIVLMCEDCDRQPRLWFSQRLFTEKCRRGEFVAPAAALMQSCVIVAVIVEQEWKMLQHQYNLPTNVNRERRKNWSLIINKSCLSEAMHVTPVAKNKDQMPLDYWRVSSDSLHWRSFTQICAISLQFIANNNNISMVSTHGHHLTRPVLQSSVWWV